MTQGRKDLLPDEIDPELLARLMALPQKRNVKGMIKAGRTAGKKGREGILSAGVAGRGNRGNSDSYKSDDNR